MFKLSPRMLHLMKIVQLMECHQIKRLPVVRDGMLVGIVSRANLLRALASIVKRDQAGGER